VKALIEAGHFRPVIDKIYPFSAIREAYVHARSGQKIGQVVVRIGTD
jgi:NADPH:quinone reductase-like Zn-dependent oxidoreductase